MYIIDNESDNLLIVSGFFQPCQHDCPSHAEMQLHPEVLVSGTSLSDAMNCNRRALLKSVAAISCLFGC